MVTCVWGCQIYCVEMVELRGQTRSELRGGLKGAKEDFLQKYFIILCLHPIYRRLNVH